MSPHNCVWRRRAMSSRFLDFWAAVCAIYRESSQSCSKQHRCRVKEWKRCLIWALSPPSSDRSVLLACSKAYTQLNFEERRNDWWWKLTACSSQERRKHFNVSSSSFLIIMWLRFLTLVALLPSHKFFSESDGWSSYIFEFSPHVVLRPASDSHQQHRRDCDFHYTLPSSAVEWNYR